MAEAGIIEIGTPLEEELDSMLRVMCAGFELPYEAARTVFHDDPYFDIKNKRVLRLNGQIVSCLSIVEAACWIGSTIIPIAGIAGVSTLSEYRRRGLAELLLKDTLETLKHRNYSLAGLFAINRDYYQRMGWESVGSIYQAVVPRTVLNSAQSSSQIKIASAEDIPALIRLYDSSSQGRTLHLLRDKKRWKYLLKHLPKTVLFQTDSSHAAGYLQYQIVPGQIDSIYPEKNTNPSLRILEFVAENETAKLELLGYLHSQEYADTVTYIAPISSLQKLFGGDMLSLYPPIPKQGAMLKILDFQKMLLIISGNWKELNGKLSLKITDTGNLITKTVTIINEHGNVCVEKDKDDTPGSIFGNERYWVQVLAGHFSAELAMAGGLLKKASDTTKDELTLLNQLFPARDPFVPNPDHF